MWRDTISEESAALLGVGIGQRLDVAADRGQRRAKLVRHVGDEVAPDLIGAAQVRDVVQHDDRATAPRMPSTGAVRAINDRRGLAQLRQLDALGRPARERRRDLPRDGWLPDDFRIVAPDRRRRCAACAAPRRSRAAVVRAR